MTVATHLRRVRQTLAARAPYVADEVRRARRAARKRWITANIAAEPAGLVPVEAAEYVLFLSSHAARPFDPELYVRELGFAHALADEGAALAITRSAASLFKKRVVWFASRNLPAPRLWDYSQQVTEFAAGLERQGNTLFCSSGEALYWENKGHMHRKLAEAGVPTPPTVVLDEATWQEAPFSFEPALVKEEHSAGSAGLHYFETAAAARSFVESYSFRPHESLIMQQVVAGATRDLRLTLVGSRVIEDATYWRAKSPEALRRREWTPTATGFSSIVTHAPPPDDVAARAATWLRKLGLRAAGIDLIWADDDVNGEPLVLELSPYFQPNPPKPPRYEHWSYKQYKESPYVKDGYLEGQHKVFKVIARALLDQGLF